MRDDVYLAALLESEAARFNIQHGGRAMFALSERSKTNRIGVDSRLIQISDRAIQISKVDFGFGRDAGVRTDARQLELFTTGKSKCDGINKRSPHQDGKALDPTAFKDGIAVWEHKFYAMIAVAFFQAANELGYRIRWGGMFKDDKIVEGVPYGWDCPHFELVD